MMSEKKEYEKPALVNCGTMVDQTGCWDGGNPSVGRLVGQNVNHGFSPHHGFGRGRR